MREVTRSVNLAAKLIPGMYKTQKAGCTWVTPALFGRETASPGNRQWWEQERERLPQQGGKKEPTPDC